MRGVRMNERAGTLWDCVVVGGGPAGLSAAIYMGRFLRRTLVVDDENGRWSYGQRNDNYLGFPRGVGARRLHELGRAQARRFRVGFEKATVTRVRRTSLGFRLDTTCGPRRARTVIWTAGVEDIWPEISGARALVGRRIFWCIVCDGWRTLDKDVLLIGRGDGAARIALQFLTYAPRLTFVHEPGPAALSARARERLVAEGVRLRGGRAISAHGRREGIGIRFDDGEVERFDYVFSLLGSKPRTAGLEELGVPLNRKGSVRVDDKNRTALERFFAAGDVTDKHSHQVTAAVHEGATAALSANAVLYPPRQKLDRA